MKIVTGFSEWLVTMRNRTVLTLWADGYSVIGDEHVFSVLMDASKAERSGLDIVARTPSNPKRVSAVLARVPSAAIGEMSPDRPSVLSGPAGSDTDDQRKFGGAIRARQAANRRGSKKTKT